GSQGRRRLLRQGQAARHAAGRRCLPGSVADEPLHAAILEGMKADDAQPPAGAEHANALGKHLVKIVQLLINMYTQRLETARGGMLALLARGQGLGDELRELPRGRKGLLGAARDDGARDSAREPLIAVLEKHARNFRFLRAAQPLGDALPRG